MKIIQEIYNCESLKKKYRWYRLLGFLIDEYKIDLNQVNDIGDSVIISAVWQDGGSESDVFTMVKFLKDRGALTAHVKPCFKYENDEIKRYDSLYELYQQVYPDSDSLKDLLAS